MVLRTALRVLALAAGTTFVGFVGILIGTSSAHVAPSVVMRTALAIALLLAMTRAFRIRDRSAADHAGRPHPQVLLVAGLAYVVNPFWWGGHTLVAQLLVPQGVFSALVDFVLWMAVALGGVYLAEQAKVHAASAPQPYA